MAAVVDRITAQLYMLHVCDTCNTPSVTHISESRRSMGRPCSQRHPAGDFVVVVPEAPGRREMPEKSKEHSTPKQRHVAFLNLTP